MRTTTGEGGAGTGRAALAFVAGIALMTGPAAAQTSTWAESRSCEAGGEPRPSLGVGTFHCRGGICLVGGVYASQRGLTETMKEALALEPGAWGFSVEPHLWEIRGDGPGGGALMEGDVLVAVNGVPVTTREAGRRLAGMRPGAPVGLTVRRDGGHGHAGAHGSRVLEVEVVAVESCASFRVSSGPAPLPAYLDASPDGRVARWGRLDRSPAPVPTEAGTARFEGAGLVLAGPTEIDVGPEGEVRWRFSGDPVVAEVGEGSAAERAGLRRGDVIVSVDDEPMTTALGVAALTGAAPGRPVLLFVRTGSSGRQVVLHER